MAKHELSRILSKLGICSRTDAVRLIKAGKVKVNGQVILQPDRFFSPENDKIIVEGQDAKSISEEPRVFILYKPKSTVTTRRDPEGRKTVFDLIPEDLGYLVAVGRLDYATTGVLLFTTSSEYAARLTDPASGVKRVYLVTVRGRVTEEDAAKLEKGVEIDGVTYSPDRVEVRKASGKETHLIVTLSEGKNREIRRIFKDSGHEVTALKRIAYGPYELGDLRPGEFKELKLVVDHAG